MAPISKPMSTATWVRKPSNAVDYRYSSALNSDGNSSNYSSGEENVRLDKKSVPSFMISDDNGRSYVDPWDMENYSFLRRQLEDINISDNELSSTPAFESTQSDFYYVPLDNNGSPQYQYKHYVDSSIYKGEGNTPPLIFRDDSYGLVAGIDEHDFYNEYLETPHPSLQSAGPESYLEFSNFSNPSRQSERSRFNNQDYQTYTPPSIIKDIPERYMTLQVPQPGLQRRSSRRSYSDLQLNSLNPEERYRTSIEYVPELPRPRRNLDFEIRQHRRKSLSDIKQNLNRRKSFHELSTESEIRSKPDRRRKSVLDHPQIEDRRPIFDIGVPEPRPREKITRSRSTCEPATDFSKIGKNYRNQRVQRKSVLQATENLENLDKIPTKEVLRDPFPEVLPPSRPYLSNVPDSSLVYVYETAKRRRKMVLPNIAPEVYASQDFRYNSPDIEDAFSMDPIENYMQRPLSRYTMTNYGHLKIDYSCSWNCLDKYIAHRVRT